MVKLPWTGFSPRTVFGNSGKIVKKGDDETGGVENGGSRSNANFIT